VGVEVYSLRSRIISDSRKKLLSQNPRRGRAYFYFKRPKIFVKSEKIQIKKI
jgi:hypothetical protein